MSEGLDAKLPGIAHRFDAEFRAAAPVWIARFTSPQPASSEPGLLSGLSFAVKDNIDVAGLPTTAGCMEFSHQPVAHAHVVSKLLGAGAALLGKTNLDQFACGLNGTRSPFGAPHNAFDARYISGGSSSGSAIAVACGEVDFALGTDTAGSGRVPAGLNNIVGFKPSKGLLSTRGVLPASQSVDCVSIFTRDLPVAIKVLSVAAGYDPLDAFSRPLSLRAGQYPEGFKFGVPRREQLKFFGDEHARLGFARSAACLESLGGSLVEIDYQPLLEVAAILYESAFSAERYAAIKPFFDQSAQAIEPSVRAVIEKSKSYSAADLFLVQTRLAQLSHSARSLWQNVDILLLPTAPTIYTIEAMRADPITLNRNLGYYTNFVNLLDMAAISVPSIIRDDGLPFGVTFIGPAGSDWHLAQLAHRFHCNAPDARARPALLDTTPGFAALVAPENLLSATVRVAVVGAHLSGMPLNWQLSERGAWREQIVQSAASYRLYALPETQPPKPGMLRVAAGEGSAITMEVWRMPVENFGSFVALIAAPLGIGSIELENGTFVQGFVCEQWAVADALDVSRFGGWKAYVASLNQQKGL
jgi:allophanate hydrolase